MTTTWDEITAALEARGGVLRYRSRNERAWRVPHPSGGTFQVEVTLRPRWCSLGVDRWHTSNREQAVAGPWFEEHIWPIINRAVKEYKGGWCTLPSGGPSYSGASVIDRADLLEVLELWIDAELTWGTRKVAS
jgi:hypothetical protein